MATAAEVQQLFDRVPERYNADKGPDKDTAIQFDLSGESGGQYWLKIVGGACETGQGQVENPNMTVRATGDDFYDVFTGKQNAMQAFMGGKLKIQGDMGLAMKLQSMFGL